MMNPILPADRYLASLLDISEEDLLRFKAEVRRRAAEAPQPAVIAGTGAEVALALAIANLVIGVGFAIAASFFKPSAPNQGRPAQLRTANRGGRSKTANERFVPRYGFDSQQEITALGEIIPIIYALRETIGGVTYGGVRANTSLLWSQLYSLGGSQLLRGLFLIGEGPMGAIDITNFASGGNTLTSYDFGNATANSGGSRMTVYSRINGGLTTRIVSGDRVFGRAANTDRGNAQNYGGTNVFQVRRNGTWQDDFCSATRPNNQTTFGLYGFIGNDFGYRINPTIKPQVQPQLVPDGNDGDAKVKCTIDDTAWAQRRKHQTIFGSRGGIIDKNLTTIGGTTTYRLYATSDKDTAFSRDLKQLTNPSQWEFTKKLIVKEGAGVFTKAKSGSGISSWVSIYDDTRDESSDVTILEDKVSAAINSITVDSKGKGSMNVTITFNIQNFWAGVDTDDSDQINQLLQTLKAGKFVLKWTNTLSGGDPEDDVTIKYTFRVLVRSKSKQTFTLNETTLADVQTTKQEVNGVLVVTDVTGGGGIVPGINIQAEYFKPKFKIRASGQPVKDEDDGPNISFTVDLGFNAKKAYIETCDEAAAAIAGRQKQWDDSLIEGELYKIGSALAVCSSRTDAAFISQADAGSGDGVPITATFTTVRTGNANINTPEQIQLDAKTWLEAWESSNNPEWHTVATVGGHILRCAIASISTTRACTAVELGIRSRMGIRIAGLCNFREALSFTDCDNRACLDYKGDIVEKGSTLKTDIHQSNTYSAPAERYSFFAIYFREAGSGSAYTKLNHAYGVRGSTQQNVFNYIQLNMPATKQWEFQIEPYSGYEVRNNDIGNLYVLDSTSSTVLNITEAGGVNVRCNGIRVSDKARTFQLTPGRRRNEKGALGIARADSDFADGDYSYIDTYGKLAEAFIYDEIRSSAEEGPEHEVVYINEIVNNPTSPLYDKLSIIGVNIMSSVEWQQFGQFSCYVTEGKRCRRLLNDLTTGSTHLFPDILLDLLTNDEYGRGDQINDNMIDLDSFQNAAQLCQSRAYFYDGAIVERVNLRQWAADVAATHLLTFGEVDGKFFLKRAMPTAPVTISGLFTAGNIKENTFQLQYLDSEDREPIQVSVRYREERASTDVTNPGMFPVVREVIVREASADGGVALESLDMSDYCTNKAHAIDAAKYIIRMRRIPTHTIRFETTYEGVLSRMAPSDYIRVAMDVTEYDQFNNGVVTPTGALVSTKGLADGSYDVIAWNGVADVAPVDTTLVVTGGGTMATPTGVVFTVKLPTAQVRTYQIERIAPTDEGTFTIEAVHMPTTAAGVLEIADNFEIGSTVSSTYWTLEE